MLSSLRVPLYIGHCRNLFFLHVSFFRLKLHDLLLEALRDLILRDLFDDLSLTDEQPFFLSAGNGDVGVSGFAWAIDDTAQKVKPRVLRLDFSQVPFMDSSGIGVIIGRTKKLKYFNDSSVSVCNMSDRVDKLLKCAGIYTIVHKL